MCRYYLNKKEKYIIKIKEINFERHDVCFGLVVIDPNNCLGSSKYLINKEYLYKDYRRLKPKEVELLKLLYE